LAPSAAFGMWTGWAICVWASSSKWPGAGGGTGAGGGDTQAKAASQPGQRYSCSGGAVGLAVGCGGRA